jgi:hypothetical protein
LDPDDLQHLPPELVAQLLGDQYLVQFVLQPVRVDPVALQAALGDIAGWEPPANAEDLVERAERYLEAIPTDAPPAWSPPQWGQTAWGSPPHGQIEWQGQGPSPEGQEEQGLNGGSG